MEIYRTEDPADFERYANECLNGHEGVVIHITKNPCVWTGRLATLDKDVAESKGLTIHYGEYLGGTIVNMKGDVSICMTTWGSTDYAPNLVDSFAEYLAEKGIEVTRDENDVLANGKKVLSWARATTIKGWTQSVIHFSVGKINLKLIKAVCIKPMVKKPGSLAEFGITTEEVLNFLGFNKEEKKL